MSPYEAASNEWHDCALSTNGVVQVCNDGDDLVSKGERDRRTGRMFRDFGEIRLGNWELSPVEDLDICHKFSVHESFS